MALTDAQKADVVLYTGWSGRFFQSDTRLDQAMSALASNPSLEALVIVEINACKDIDTRLATTYVRLKALAVGSIELPQHSEIVWLRSEGRRRAGRIASMLGVEIRHDVFAGYGPKTFASAAGSVPGTYGGHYVPQG